MGFILLYGMSALRVAPPPVIYAFVLSCSGFAPPFRTVHPGLRMLVAIGASEPLGDTSKIG